MPTLYEQGVIRSFASKGLRELFETGRTAKVDRRFHKRILVRLDALNAAGSLRT